MHPFSNIGKRTPRRYPSVAILGASRCLQGDGMTSTPSPAGDRRSGARVWLLSLAVALFLCLALGASAQAASPTPLVFRGSAERKWIALTFDDNTVPGPTLDTLRVLREYRVPATLFLCGYAVNAFPQVTDEIRQGVETGLFEVGDHSATHADLTAVPATDLLFQIGGGTDAFREATGSRTVPLFRPPYGRNNSLLAQTAGERGFSHMVLWDVGTEDWTGESPQAIERNIVSRAHNGAIVLLHMAAPNTATALPGIITRLRAAGYQFVPVSAMLRDRLFLDVEPASELGRALPTLTAPGIMSGYDADRFGPGRPLTRRQAAKIIATVAGIHTEVVEEGEYRTFWDVAPTYNALGGIEPYPYDFVEEAVAAGLVNGSVDGLGRQVFHPDAIITRVQFAQILARMWRQLKGDPASTAGTFPTFPDVPAYAAADVALVAALGLMNGYSPTRFGPYEPALRGHVAVVTARYLGLVNRYGR